MASKIPSMFENIEEDKKCICISAIKRQPNWLLYQIHDMGCWDDLFISALLPAVENPELGLHDLYNAAQRSIYQFIKETGYRKTRKFGKVLWEKKEINNGISKK